MSMLRRWADRRAENGRNRRDVRVIGAIHDKAHTAAAIADRTGLSLPRVYACLQRLEALEVVDPYLQGQLRAWRLADVPGGVLWHGPVR